MEIIGVLKIVTIASVIIIVCAFLWAWGYVVITSRKKMLFEKKRWIEQLPSIISTLGVLGTFLGITIGLLYFDTRNLDDSIPLLLSGLKTAFITSLAGMIGSLVLTRIVNKLYDDTDKGESDINTAAALITKSVKEMSDANVRTMSIMLEHSTKQLDLLERIFGSNLEIADILKNAPELKLENKIDLLNQSLGNKLDAVNTGLHTIQTDIALLPTMSETMVTSLEALGNLDVSVGHVSDEIDKLSGVLQSEVGDINTLLRTQFVQLTDYINKVNTQIANDILAIMNTINSKIDPLTDELKKITSDTAVISGINDNVAMALEALGNLDMSEQHVSEEIEMLGNKMSSDIAGILVKMTDTDKLLNEKFDEFTKLMEKNDMESLSEFLKKFASEFQEQMNNLLNKLVEDNFKELNKSVTTLNNWQKENKVMVEAMIKQYKDMEEDFESTSTTLAAVEEKTRDLVADDGKLYSIVESLNQLLLEDKNFLKVIEQLKSAASINRQNSETLNSSAKNLKEWISTQRNFVDGINQLITKLDEISKFRDYNGAFWRDTKIKLKEGLDILAQGTEELNKQVVSIDKQFYSRLNTTLANLDACIQAMYNGKIK